MSGECWVSTWVMAAVAVSFMNLGVVVAEPAAARAALRHPRQVTSPTTNDVLLCQFEASAGVTSPECKQILSSNPPLVQPQTPPKPVQTPSPGCICTRHWQCLDNAKGQVFPPAGEDGEVVDIVDVRTGAMACPAVEDICCNKVNMKAPAPLLQPYTPGCGNHNPKGIGVTYEGFTKNAQFGEFPWMAVVMTADKPLGADANAYIGGGSLIHPEFVMTAAHYVEGKTASELAVRLGEWNIQAATESIKHVEILVSKIHVHPQFNRRKLTHDVALLQLQQAAPLGPTIDTICLPNPSQKFDGSLCLSSGWGKDLFGMQGKYQQILKTVALPAVSHQACEAALRGTRLGPRFRLSKTFMCAGGEPGKDLCTGDGGSPLVCPMPENPTTYVQAGIVAWGIGCGSEGVPGVYADVGQAMEWIDSVLQTVSNFDVRLGFRNG
ncbi:hypothetical protein OTU49_006490 [Cherax quadricarinatus]|uniref:Peptidase S1 domain-containing protein n=1 Tax=Cherax quadricarinatus TaxID=27406 RepID=A0AAW0YIG6_CHEQU